MTRIQKNWINLTIILIFLSLIYYFYKIDMLTYVCEKEANAPACYLLGMEYKELNDLEKSKRYLELSCDLKYERACKVIK